MSLFAGVVAGVRSSPEARLVPVLRCLRRLWGLVTAGSHRLQRQAAAALGLPGYAAEAAAPAPAAVAVEDEEVDAEQRAAVLGAVCREVQEVLWIALQDCYKRPPALCAALVTTALPQHLFVFDSPPSQAGGSHRRQPDLSAAAATAAAIDSLHAPGGPLKWALGNLIACGANSARLTLMLALQLGSFLQLQPRLIDRYRSELQQLLLFGQSDRGGYPMGVEPEALVDEPLDAEEVGGLPRSADPHLAATYSATHVGPRIVVAAALHEVGRAAGLCLPVKGPPDWQARLLAGRTGGGGANGGDGGGEGGNAAAAAGGGGAASYSELLSSPQPQPQSKRVLVQFGDTPVALESSAAASSATAGGGGAVAAEPRPPLASHMEGTYSSSAVSAASAAAAAATATATTAAYRQEAVGAGRALWDALLETALTDPTLSGDRLKLGSQAHRQKVRLWQALTVAAAFVTDEAGALSAVRGVMANITTATPGNVKQYQEAVIAALLLRQPQLLEAVGLPILEGYRQPVAALSPIILVVAQVVLHVGPQWQRRLVPRLLLAALPWLSEHSLGVRTFAQLTTITLLEAFPLSSDIWGVSAASNDNGTTDNGAPANSGRGGGGAAAPLGSHPHDARLLAHLTSFLSVNADVVRLRRAMGDGMLAWRPDGEPSKESGEDEERTRTEPDVT